MKKSELAGALLILASLIAYLLGWHFGHTKEKLIAACLTEFEQQTATAAGFGICRYEFPDLIALQPVMQPRYAEIKHAVFLEDQAKSLGFLLLTAGVSVLVPAAVRLRQRRAQDEQAIA